MVYLMAAACLVLLVGVTLGVRGRNVVAYLIGGLVLVLLFACTLGVVVPGLGVPVPVLELIMSASLWLAWGRFLRRQEFLRRLAQRGKAKASIANSAVLPNSASAARKSGRPSNGS